jgi:hypothetical protein
MPSSSVDPERLVGLAATLENLRAVARQGADEVLEHFPEVGDRSTQTALDAFLEQAADTLRAVDAESGELAGRLRIAAATRPATPLPRSAETSGTGDAHDSATSPRKGLFR